MINTQGHDEVDGWICFQGSNVPAVCWSMVLMLLVGLPLRAPGACICPYLVNIFSNSFDGYSIF